MGEKTMTVPRFIFTDSVFASTPKTTPRTHCGAPIYGGNTDAQIQNKSVLLSATSLAGGIYA